MRKVNPLYLFTGFSLAALAAVAGVTYDEWSNAGPGKIVPSVATIQLETKPAAEVQPSPGPAPAEAVAAKPEQPPAAPEPIPAEPETAAAPPPAPAETTTARAVPAQPKPAEPPAAEAKAPEPVASPPAAEPPPVVAEAPEPAASPPPAAPPGVELNPPDSAAPPPPVAEAEAPVPAVEPPAAAIKPSFDTVRVDATGEAIAAGSAKPGAEVTLKLDGQVIGRTTANDNGAWVVVPDKPLPPGAGALSLEQASPGEAPVESDATVAVAVPESRASRPLVALVAPEAPVRVIQAPEPRKPLPGKAVALDTIDYTDAGDIVFSGRAEAGAAVRLYVDNVAKGDAVANASGAWTFKGGAEIPAGNHTLRVDRLDTGGKVVSRVELPFVRESSERVAALVDEPEPAPAPNAAAPSPESAPQAAVPPEPAPAPQAAAPPEPAPAPDAAAPSPESAPQAAVPPAPAPPREAAAPSELTPAPQAAEPPEPASVPDSVTPPQPAAAAAAGVEPKPAEEAAVAAASPPAEAAPPQKKVGRVIIQPGNNLWKLSRVIYGRGVHYTVIYEANKDQIRNPSRIYPGQIFTTPNAAPPEAIDPKRREPLSAAEGGAPPP